MDIKENNPIIQLLEGTNDNIFSPYLDMTVSGEVSDEFTLADYYPEIRRVVSVTARAIPEGKFISSGKIDCDGTVAFNVIYIGDDSELCSVSFAVQFSQTADYYEPDGIGGEIMYRTFVDNHSAKVTEPRRITLKAHIRTKIWADMEQKSEEKTVDEKGKAITGADYISLERKTEQAETAKVLYGGYSGSIDGNVHQIKNGRAISTDGVINIIDAHSSDGEVSVRGEAIIYILCKGDDGIYFNQKDKSPIEVQIPINGAKSGDNATCCGRITSITVNETDSGLDYEAEFDLDVQVMQTNPVMICTDAYSTSFDSNVEYTEKEILTPVKCGVYHLTQNGEIKRKSETVSGEYPIFVNGNATVEKVEVSDGKLTVSGTVNASVVLAQNGEIITEEGKIPFSVTTDSLTDSTQLPVIRADVQVVDITARADGDKISITAELTISACILDRRKISFVDTVILDKTSPKAKQNGIHIYYPEENDNPWSIAKRYSCCRRTLQQLNKIDENAEKVGSKPIIII